MRIISLVPSLTELVCALGRQGQLIACTQFCVRPRGLPKGILRVGGTKDPSLELIRSLRPTHILVNREENLAEHIAACQEIAAVCLTFPKSPKEVPALIRDIAAFLDVAAAGESLAQAVSLELAAIRSLLEQKIPAHPSLPPVGSRYLYFIWTKPWMVVSRDTYISRMLDLLGWVNVAPLKAPARYPELSLEEAQSSGAQLLLLSSEPWPFRRRDLIELRRLWPTAPPAQWIDGRLMSWYGSSTLEALGAMRKGLTGEEGSFLRPLDGRGVGA